MFRNSEATRRTLGLRYNNNGADNIAGRLHVGLEWLCLSCLLWWRKSNVFLEAIQGWLKKTYFCGCGWVGGRGMSFLFVYGLEVQSCCGCLNFLSCTRVLCTFTP